MKRILWPFLLALLVLGSGRPGWTFLSSVVEDTNYWLAVQAYQNQNYDTAIAIIEKKFRVGVDDGRLRNLLGWALLKQGDYTRAKIELQRALQMEPDGRTAFYAQEGLGWVAQKTGDYDRAIVYFRESLRHHPDYYSAYNGLGWSRLGKGDLGQAEANYSAVLQSEPESIDAVQRLRIVAYHRGQWAKAIRLFGRVFNVKREDTVTQSALAWAFYYKKAYAKSSWIFRSLLGSAPTWADPFLGLAWIAEREDYPKKAKSYFQSAIRKSATYVATVEFQKLLMTRPDWMDLWRDLGWALYFQRNFSRAETEFSEFL